MFLGIVCTFLRKFWQGLKLYSQEKKKFQANSWSGTCFANSIGMVKIAFQ